MKQNFTKVIFILICLLFTLSTKAQPLFTVTITSINVNSQPIDINSQPINFGTNQNITVNLQVEIYTTSPGVYYTTGGISIYRSSTGSVNNGATVAYSTITLSGSNTYKNFFSTRQKI